MDKNEECSFSSQVPSIISSFECVAHYESTLPTHRTPPIKSLRSHLRNSVAPLLPGMDQSLEGVTIPAALHPSKPSARHAEVTLKAEAATLQVEEKRKEKELKLRRRVNIT